MRDHRDRVIFVLCVLLLISGAMLAWICLSALLP